MPEVSTPHPENPLFARRPVRHILLFASTLSGCLVHAQSANHPTLQQLHGPAAEQVFRKADQKQLPPAVTLDPAAQQIFQLNTPGSPPLGIVATSFQASSQQTSGQCGLFFVQENGTSRYVPALGSPHSLPKYPCAGIRAVGLLGNSEPHPVLIVIFTNIAAGGKPVAFPFLYVWNEAGKRYTRDEIDNTRLYKSTDPTDTIAQVRDALSELH